MIRYRTFDYYVEELDKFIKGGSLPCRAIENPDNFVQTYVVNMISYDPSTYNGDKLHTMLKQHVVEHRSLYDYHIDIEPLTRNECPVVHLKPTMSLSMIRVECHNVEVVE